MTSNKEESPAPLHAAKEATKTLLAGWSAFKVVTLISLLALLPFGAWLIGSGIVMVTPPVYRSGALLRVNDSEGRKGNAHQEGERLKSGDVVGQAARTLAGVGQGATTDPMSEYILWSSLSVNESAGPNLIRVEARSGEPDEARRIVMAVVDAYEKNLHAANPDAAVSKALVYVAPMESEPTRVPDETRMVLGIAGFASLCMLLCIPFLRYIEDTMPLRLKAAEIFGGGATRTVGAA